MTTIVIGSDHRGYPYAERLCEHVHKMNFFSAKLAGHRLIRVGVKQPDVAIDYPQVSYDMSREIQQGATFGVLVCGSGFGVAIAANRHQNVRAVTCRTVEDAKAARAHNNANVLCVGSDFSDYNQVCMMLKIFATTRFDGDLEGGERHANRVKMIDDLAS